MIEAFAWVALALVIFQLWTMGSRKYTMGWWLAIAACFAWGAFAVGTHAWALLVQQFVIAGLAIRGLWKLR